MRRKIGRAQIAAAVCVRRRMGDSALTPTRHAISRCYSLINRNHLYYVVDIDIKGFFDNIDHGKLLKQMYTMGIRDKRLLGMRFVSHLCPNTSVRLQSLQTTKRKFRRKSICLTSIPAAKGGGGKDRRTEPLCANWQPFEKSPRSAACTLLLYEKGAVAELFHSATAPTINLQSLRRSFSISAAIL